MILALLPTIVILSVVVGLIIHHVRAERRAQARIDMLWHRLHSIRNR